MSDLTEAIREALADPEHEDWCDTRMVEDGRECRCFMGPRTAALVAVLDRIAGSVRIEGWEIREIIARALGVSEEVDRSG